MAFNSAKLYNVSGIPPGSADYLYRTSDDTKATVEASGYFHNTDDNINMAAGDFIRCRCTDGNMQLRVSSVSAGSITTQVDGVSSPRQTSDDTSTATDTLGYGYTEIGTGSATKYFIPAPYAGAVFELYVGATAGTGSVLEFITAATAQTLNVTGNTTITTGRNSADDWFQLEGVSSTRWVIRGRSLLAVLG